MDKSKKTTSKRVYLVEVKVTIPGGTEGVEKVKKKDIRAFVQGQFPFDPQMIIGGGYKPVKVQVSKDVNGE